MPWKNAPYWLVPVTCSFLYYTTQDHQPRSGTAHDGLAPPTSITNKVPHKLPIGQFYGSIFSIVILTSQIGLVFFFFFCQLTKKSIRMLHYIFNKYLLFATVFSFKLNDISKQFSKAYIQNRSYYWKFTYELVRLHTHIIRFTVILESLVKISMRN